MAKLSEQLADWAVCVKHAEDTRVAAQKEARDKVMARGDKARADTSAAIQKVDKSIKFAGDGVRFAGDTAKKWTELQTKVAADLESSKSDIAKKSMIGTLGARKARPIGLSGKRALQFSMLLPFA
jgi:hypothetical protein